MIHRTCKKNHSQGHADSFPKVGLEASDTLTQPGEQYNLSLSPAEPGILCTKKEKDDVPSESLESLEEVRIL